MGQQQCGACLKHPPSLDRCLAAVPYAFPWSGLIGDFKFHDATSLATCFAALLRATPWVEPALEDTAHILPIPLSSQRLRERGYNQALLLARALYPEKTRSEMLLRIQDTPAQHTLKRAQRLVTLNDSFALEPLLLPEIRGARLIVLDDVMTTGATLNSAARVLKAAGAAQVTGLVLARTEQRQ